MVPNTLLGTTCSVSTGSVSVPSRKRVGHTRSMGRPGLRAFSHPPDPPYPASYKRGTAEPRMHTPRLPSRDWTPLPLNLRTERMGRP